MSSFDLITTKPSFRNTSQQLPDIIGQTLDGRYLLNEEIGKGGMGRVFKAYDTSNYNACAVKVMHRHLQDNSLSVQRFERESRITLKLNHPNIVKVNDFGFTAQKEPYFVMEFLEGINLGKLIAQKEKLSPVIFFSVFSQVCDGLQYAHEQGVVHRDVKPSNIMIVKESGLKRAKLVDFGLARICETVSELYPNSIDELRDTLHGARAITKESRLQLQRLTQPGEVFGSPLYMSPEQCQGDEADSASEVFSLGCMMFEALLGEPPLRGETPVETLFKRINHDAPLINEVDASKQFPHSVEMLIARTLERKRKRRIQTIGQVKEILNTISEDLL